VWVSPSGTLVSKTRVIPIGVDANKEVVPVIERWTAQTANEPILLSPCHYLPDPLRPQPSFISLCEVRDKEDECPATNYRGKLRKLIERDQTTWWGFRQEYGLITDPQQPENTATFRDWFAVAERHLGACMDAGLMIHSADLEGGNFKVGVRGMPTSIDPDAPNALVIADHLWIARYLLKKVAREQGLLPSYSGKRCTTFLSTATMRQQASTGIDLAEILVRFGTRLAKDESALWEPSLRASVVSQQGGFECIEDQGPPGHFDP
jgi:glutamine synthetase